MLLTFYDGIMRCAMYIWMSQITDDIIIDYIHLCKKSPTSICSNEIVSLTRSQPSIKDDPVSMNTKWLHRGRRYASLRMCSHPLPFYATP